MRLHYSDLLVDTDLHEVRLAGKVVGLTETEYRLLLYLLQHQGAVCQRDTIIDAVWSARFLYDTGTLDVHLSSLRRKLHWTRQGPLRSVRGVGYLLPQRPSATPTEAGSQEAVRISTFLRELLLEREDKLREKGIHCRLNLTPFVYEIFTDEGILRQIFSAIFGLFLSHAPQAAQWKITSQLTLREYIISLTSGGNCPDFSELLEARQQAAFLGISLRMGNKITSRGNIIGAELAIPMERMES